MFYLAGIFIAYFACFLIMGKSGKVYADYLLAVWFLVIGIHLSLFFLLISGNYIRFPYLLGLEIPLPLIHGPLLYLYVTSLTQGNHRKYSKILHFLPCLVIYFILWDFFSLSLKEKISVYQNGGGIYRELRKYINLMIYTSGFLYTGLSILVLRGYRKEISKQYSNIETIQLNWVYYLILGVALIWVLVIFKDDTITFTSVVIFVLFAAYFGISKAGILNMPEIKSEINTNVEPGNEGYIKYQKSALSEKALQEIYQKLNFKMESEKLFKDPELNLNITASMLEIHPNLLSQTINSIENKNFYDYINTKRVEEFKKIALLPENQKFTILSLAYESGFNSKTSFNRNFKKYMNCSPREFLKGQNLNLL